MCFLLIALAYPAISNAEDTMLKRGSKAIAFSINSGIEMRGSYFFSDDWSWLVGFGYNQWNRRSKQEDSDSSRDSNDKQRVFTVSTGPKYYFYKNDINLFTEGLIEYEYGKTRYQYHSTSTNFPDYHSSDGTIKGIGIRLNFGVEYFLAKKISLSGIVGLRYYDDETKTDYEGENTFDSGTTSTSGFSTVQGALQVNFYF